MSFWFRDIQDIFGFATFLNICIIPQAGRTIQGNAMALNAIVVGITPRLMGVEVSSMAWTDDISASQWHPGKGFNVAFQRCNLNTLMA